MSYLGRRLDKLESGRPRPSPYDAMDPILAEMSTPELISLVHYGNAIREGRRPTAKQEAAHRAFWDRMAFAGIVLP